MVIIIFIIASNKRKIFKDEQEYSVFLRTKTYLLPMDTDILKATSLTRIRYLKTKT